MKRGPGQPGLNLPAYERRRWRRPRQTEHEATVHQIGNAVRTILQSGLSPADLFSNEEATERTVEECLRFAAPLHIFQRYALMDMELEDGIVLKKGEKIGLMAASLLAAERNRPEWARALATGFVD